MAKVRTDGFLPPYGGRIFNWLFGGCNLKSGRFFQDRRPVQAESVSALDADIHKLSNQFSVVFIRPLRPWRRRKYDNLICARPAHQTCSIRLAWAFAKKFDSASHQS